MSYALSGPIEDAVRDYGAAFVEGAYPTLQARIRADIPSLVEEATPTVRAKVMEAVEEAIQSGAVQAGIGDLKKNAVVALGALAAVIIAGNYVTTKYL